MICQYQREFVDVDWPFPVAEQNLEEFKAVVKEAFLRQELQQYCESVIKEIQQNGSTSKTYDDLAVELNRIAEEHGFAYGLPLPSNADIDRPLILARGAPLSQLEGARQTTEFAEEIAANRQRGVRVRNSWHHLGDQEVCVLDVEGTSVAWPRYDAGTRLRKLVDGALMRSGGQQTAEAELRAMDSLKKRVTKCQWDSYVLNGLFAEKSKRSDLHYFFRKGYPTLVLSYHDGYHKCPDGGHIIAALCLHPLGYYDGTHTGLLCPTDEVICALLMMRADEWKFWQSSGQWSASDTRSGL